MSPLAFHPLYFGVYHTGWEPYSCKSRSIRVHQAGMPGQLKWFHESCTYFPIPITYHTMLMLLLMPTCFRSFAWWTVWSLCRLATPNSRRLSKKSARPAFGIGMWVRRRPSMNLWMWSACTDPIADPTKLVRALYKRLISTNGSLSFSWCLIRS